MKQRYITTWALLVTASIAAFIAYLIIHYGQVRAWTHHYNVGGSMTIVWLLIVLFREARVKSRRIRNEYKNWKK